MGLVSQLRVDRAFHAVRFRTSALARNGRRLTPYRLGYLVSHPIQYQAPLLRYIAQDPEIDLTVFYTSDMGARVFRDPQFNVDVKWDMPLLGGYRHVFLSHWGGAKVTPLLRPFTVGLKEALRSEHLDALWIHGYKHQVQLRAIYAARRLGIPILVRGESNGLEDGAMPRISARVLRRLFRKIDGHLYIGTRNRRFYAERGVQAERLFSVPYAVDNDYFQRAAQEASLKRADLRAALEIRGWAPIILFAGKLMAGKRPVDLLMAYRDVVAHFAPDEAPYLIYAGDGEEREGLERRVRELSLDRVRLAGFINQSELPRYYDLCDVFVLPSERDRWGLAVNEAMNAGKAIIVTDKVGCAPDLVYEGENGFVVPVGDRVCLAARLLSLMQNREMCFRMGHASRQIVTTFGFREDLEGMKQALHEVCGAAHGRPVGATVA